ncbi:hypothetical protein II906_00450 [bacterium]|nr:hypothetical protein [bacterium]
MLNISFKGCVPPYFIGSTKITPIAKNPSPNDIEKAIRTVQKEPCIGSGLNGDAFFMGQDLVVKKYLNPEAAKREISILDGMYDRGVIIPNAQQGMYAFSGPEGDYLVSTRINGKTPNCITNPFNTANMTSLVNSLYRMDKLKQIKDNAIQDESDEYFPYYVVMHYDLHDGNINITDKEGGILDFEFLNYYHLSQNMMRQKEGPQNACDCNFSDIPGITSNLRGFEYRTLSPYLFDMQKKCPEKIDKFFTDYLKIKSEYHYKREHDFMMEAREGGKSSELNWELAEKEHAHAEMLRKPTPEVIAAEKIKIQMADFIFTQSEFEGFIGRRINKKQIEEYVNKAKGFFYKKAEESSKNKNERLYWEDCAQLMRNWSDVINWMDWQDTKLDLEYFNWNNIPEEERTEDYKKSMQVHYEHHMQNYELFNKKKSDKYQPVLFDINTLKF